LITLDELLEDKVYRSYFAKVPRIKNKNRVQPPWVLYLQHRETKQWHSKRFAKYGDAYAEYKRLNTLGKVMNASICSPGQGFSPPLAIAKIRGKFHTDAQGIKRQVTKPIAWKAAIPPEEEVHDWCPYCRRPTIFGYYTSHHALNHLQAVGISINPSLKRCSICGASTNVTKKWKR